MKDLLFISVLLLLCTSTHAQTASPLRTFKSKEAKVRAGNLHDLKLNNGNVELTAFIKKGAAEKLTFNTELVLQSRIDTVFDFEGDEKKKKRSFWESWSASIPGYSNTDIDLIKADVLEVASSDAISKAFGTNLVQKGKIGLKSGLGFAVQKGDIKLVTQTNNYGEGDLRGNKTQSYTMFFIKEEMKLKSDEGKNISYEFHSSNAEAVQVAFKETFSFKSNGANRSSSTSQVRKLISEDGDLLLIGKRRPIIKFGKAPSNEDLLPVYYVFKISPKTMDIVARHKFSEPYARGFIFRESLPKNEGVLLISAPTDITGDKCPTDPNPRNYIFRFVGNDTKLKYEFPYEVPSGFTQFSQAFEMADKSIVLIAAINLKKKDKYVNQGTISVPHDQYYVMTIKDGKVTQTQLMGEDEFNAGFILPPGEKAGKTFYNPAYELTKNTSNQSLPDGGMLSVWTVKNMGPNNAEVYSGDVALQFSADGKLVAKYWLASKSVFIPALETEVFKKNDHEFYLLTHVADDKGTLVASHLTQIDLKAKTMGARILVGDERHVLNTKFPYVQSSDNDIQFFGFDKGGKEFWTQKVSF